MPKMRIMLQILQMQKWFYVANVVTVVHVVGVGWEKSRPYKAKPMAKLATDKRRQCHEAILCHIAELMDVKMRWGYPHSACREYTQSALTFHP